MDLAAVKTQEQAIEILEGLAEEGRDGLQGGVLRRALVKTYMLEFAPKQRTGALGSVLSKAGIILEPMSGDFSKIWDSNEGQHVGFLEQLVERHPVIYTNEKSRTMDRWVRRLVQVAPAIDRLWVSGVVFDRLWQRVIKDTPGYRYGRLVFQHENLFETDSDQSAFPFRNDALQSGEPQSAELEDDEQVASRSIDNKSSSC